MHGGSRYTHIKNGSRPYNTSRWYEWPTNTEKPRWNCKEHLAVSFNIKNQIVWRIHLKYYDKKWELKNLCLEYNLYLIDHGSTINTRHVNGSKLHLYKKGTRILFNNFKEAISNILQWQFLLHSSYNGHNSKGDHDSNNYSVDSLKSIRDVQSLKDIRMRKMNRIILGHLNINSLRNKFESLQEQINKNVDILLISEIKLDNSFLTGQFLIKGYSAPYRLDGDAQGGGIMLFIREDIPSKLLAVEDFPTEWFYIEINLRKKKWLLCCSYNPKKSNIRAHLECLNKSLALHLLKYEHFLVLGDFNICVEYGSMSDFCDTYNLKSLIRQPKCYKNPENPSCIDLILTNIPFSFQNLVCLRQVFQIFIGWQLL